MPRQQQRQYGSNHIYKRRSQVYKRLRTRKLASGRYLVEHEPSKTEYFIFKRIDREEQDWVVADKEGSILRSGFRKKDDAMEALAEKGPRAVA